jgi:hypothetical protein
VLEKFLLHLEVVEEDERVGDLEGAEARELVIRAPGEEGGGEREGERGGAGAGVGGRGRGVRNTRKSEKEKKKETSGIQRAAPESD